MLAFLFYSRPSAHFCTTFSHTQSQNCTRHHCTAMQWHTNTNTHAHTRILTLMGRQTNTHIQTHTHTTQKRTHHTSTHNTHVYNTQHTHTHADGNASGSKAAALASARPKADTSNLPRFMQPTAAAQGHTIHGQGAASDRPNQSKCVYVGVRVHCVYTRTHTCTAHCVARACCGARKWKKGLGHTVNRVVGAVRHVKDREYGVTVHSEPK